MGIRGPPRSPTWSKAPFETNVGSKQRPAYGQRRVARSYHTRSFRATSVQSNQTKSKSRRDATAVFTLAFQSHIACFQQPQFRSAANCLGARATVEGGKNVGDMHLHGARAEDERAGDLGVGLPERYELEDLALATDQAAGAKTRR